MRGRVEIDRRPEVMTRHEKPHLAHMLSDGKHVALDHGGGVCRIHALRLHAADTSFAIAVVIVVDVEPEAVQRVALADLLDLPQDHGVIRSAGGGAEVLPTGVGPGVAGFRLEVPLVGGVSAIPQAIERYMVSDSRCVAELGERVDRLEELQAAQALQTGKILVKGEDVDDIIDFGFAPEQLPVLTNTAKWSDTTNSTPLDDLQKWHEETRKRSGLVPSMVLADSAAIRFLLKNKNVIGNTGLLSSFRVTLGQIDPQKMNAQGVKYWGYLQDPGIDLWSYDAYYEDPVSGLTVPYINPGTVLMIGEGARLTRHYGAIEDLGATAQVSRFAKSWVTDDPSARWVMVQSAPLCVPHQIDAITCATVL